MLDDERWALIALLLATPKPRRAKCPGHRQWLHEVLQAKLRAADAID